MKFKDKFKAIRQQTKATKVFLKLCPKCQNNVKVIAQTTQTDMFKDPLFYCDKCRPIIKKYYEVK